MTTYGALPRPMRFRAIFNENIIRYPLCRIPLAIPSSPGNAHQWLEGRVQPSA